MEIDRDLVAPWKVVGSTIHSFVVIKLEGEWSASFSDKKRKGSSSRACGVATGHSDGAET